MPDRHIELLRPVILAVARRYAAATGHALAADDLAQVALLAVWTQIKLAVPMTEQRARCIAKRAMQDEARRSDWLSRGDRGHIKRAATAGPTSTLAERAIAAGVSVDTMAQLERADAAGRAVLAGNEAVHDPEAPHEYSPEAMLLRRQMARLAAAAVENLPERLQEVLALIYDDGMTFAQAAEVMGITAPRVYQLHERAIAELTQACAPPNPKPAAPPKDNTPAFAVAELCAADIVRGFDARQLVG